VKETVIIFLFTFIYHFYLLNYETEIYIMQVNDKYYLLFSFGEPYSSNYTLW